MAWHGAEISPLSPQWPPRGRLMGFTMGRKETGRKYTLGVLLHYFLLLTEKALRYVWFFTVSQCGLGPTVLLFWTGGSRKGWDGGTYTHTLSQEAEQTTRSTASSVSEGLSLNNPTVASGHKPSLHLNG